MRAYRWTEATETYDTLRAEPIARRELKPTEVRVRVRAASLNYRDLLVARGVKSPRVPLSDGAGVVTEVGAAVTRFRVGDRVMGAFFPTWLDGTIRAAHHDHARGGPVDGMLADEVIDEADAFVHTPAHLDDVEASTLPCAGLTAWHALYESTVVRPGESVLALGSGGVSTFAIQLASRAGAKVIATSSSDAKAARLRELGAVDVIDRTTHPDWADEVVRRHGEVDHVIEVGGAGTLAQSFRAARHGGRVALIGVLSGFGTTAPAPILLRSLRVDGIYVGSVAMFERFARAVETAKLRPVVDRVFAVEETKAAFEHLASGRHLGKVVIRLAE
ncbi:MAG: NAD(P)-dependent alcohol dehydrogenase [Myxococcales bacterium]|nr:NAD(P)-dependent alcohol dehydrogenase [Myxococcales bacterium]